MTLPVPLSAGTIFADQFRVVQQLGAGGMGLVFAVEQWRTGHLRALKLMAPALVGDARMRARFFQEATIGSLIRSDHVAHVVDAGIDAATGTPWIAMELLVGSDLAVVLGTRGPLPPEEVQEIFAQLCHAIDAAHEAGVVHRDLKPPNVFLAESRREGAPVTVKVLDFGIAKLVAEAGAAVRDWLGDHPTAAVGTPAWMAPEQAEAGAPITPAADIWALGLLAFSMLTGRSFWRAVGTPDPGGVRVLREIAYDPIPPASVRALTLGCGPLPDGFDHWFARAVVRAPAHRFARARDARAAFDKLFEPRPRATPSMRPTPSRRPLPPRRAPEDVATHPVRKPQRKRVLLVDDNPVDQLLVGHLLSEAGYEVTPAESGEEALARITTDLPALVLLDHFLPDMDAPEVLRRLRSQQATRDLPVILISGTGAAAHVAAGFQAGANDYLMKPVDGRRLAERVEAALQSREAARRARAVSALERRHGALVADLEQARAQQEAPLSALPAAWRGGWAVAGLLSAGLVAGDSAALYEGPGDARTLALIDVAGHGAAAALSGASVRAALSVLLRAHSPTEALAALNDELASPSALRRASVALLRFEGATLTVINAGLPPIVIAREGAPLHRVDPRGGPLGVFPAQTYEALSFELRPGDRVAAVSDGLLEPFGPTDEPRWVLDSLRAFDRDAWTGAERPAEVSARLRALLADAEQTDDAVFLLAGVEPS